MHPPDLTRLIDADGDGVAETSQTLIKNLYNPIMQRDRGADHTTNGIQLGIDGWIYVAVGDFGAFQSVGADGTKLTMRGGGIVRVRSDGSGLEVYANGTRNIYDVAIDPVMNIFTRDNTNDGDGWNDRLTYSPSPDPFADQPGSVSQDRTLSNFGVKSDVTYSAGRHNVKFGGSASATRLHEQFTLGFTQA